MTGYYDDNFGHWDGMDDPEMRSFYWEVQKTNVRKKCRCCGKMVRLRPDYDMCNSCADAHEQGIDY